MLAEQCNNICVVVFFCLGQGRFASVVLGVDIGAFGNEQCDDLCMTGRGRFHEGCPVPVFHVDLGTLGNEPLNQLDIASRSVSAGWWDAMMTM